MRVEQLTFTRFVAAIFIVIFHFGEELFPFNKAPLSVLVTQADLYVSYFFVLSGFVMIVAYSNKEHINTLEYYKKRFARIYPVYLLAIITLVGFMLVTKEYNFDGILLNLFLIQAWVPGKTTSFNGPGWSLSVEMLFYFIFPFLFNYIYKKKNKKILTAMIIAIWLVTQIFFTLHFGDRPDNFLSFFPLMHINEFLMGNLAGLLFIWKLHRRKANYDWLILILMAFLVLILKFHPELVNYHDGILVLLYVPLIIAIALNTGILTSIFKMKPLVYLGEISYSIYILQIPVFYWCLATLHHFHLSLNLVGFAIFATILILASSVSYWCIELPLRERIKKLDLPTF
jgi:peptidoglycan/LPS O-acetylase OafA/YrhL